MLQLHMRKNTLKRDDRQGCGGGGGGGVIRTKDAKESIISSAKNNRGGVWRVSDRQTDR